MEEYQSIYYATVTIWYIIFIIFIFYLSQVYSGEYKSPYKNSNYTKLPSNKPAVELSLLMYRKIIPEVLTASILSMVDKGIFKLEKIENDFILHLNNVNQNKLSTSERFVIDFLMNTIGERSNVAFSKIGKFCDSKHGCDEFLLNYQLWLDIVRKENTITDFFEPKTCYEQVKFYKYVALVLFTLNIVLGYHSVIGYGLILPALFLKFYFLNIFKRTREANDEYYKWLSLRKHLYNIGQTKLHDGKQTDYLYYGILLKIKNIESLFDSYYCFGELNEHLTRCVRKAYRGSGTSKL